MSVRTSAVSERTRWGSYSVPPDPLAVKKGERMEGRGRKELEIRRGRKGRERRMLRDREGREGRMRGKGGKGRKEKEGEGNGYGRVLR